MDGRRARVLLLARPHERAGTLPVLPCGASRSGGMGGGGSAYGGSRGMGGPREFFTATCSNCGGEARVPFQPRGDKPVYCSSCFEQVRPSASRSRYA